MSTRITYLGCRVVLWFLLPMVAACAAKNIGNQELQTETKEEVKCDRHAPLPGNVPEDADAAALHLLGQKRILAREGAAAVPILALAYRKDPSNPYITGDYATALLQCGFLPEAIIHAQKARELAPDDVDIAANLAQTYQIAGRLGEAVTAYRKAIEVAPKDAAVYNNLAVLLVLSDVYGAEKAVRTAVKLAPDNPTYHVNLGYILFRQQRFAEAETVLRRALERDPQNADAYNQLGLVFAARHTNQWAKEAFQKALERNPNHRAAKENLRAMSDGPVFSGSGGEK
jgi:Flp pilus assembly protein TadD